MKYNIHGYSQTAAIKYGLTLNDTFILRVLSDIFYSSSPKLEFINYKNQKYMWITYGYLFREIPIFGTERTIINRINSLVKKNFLKKIVLNSKKGMAGKYMFISFGENYKKLFENYNKESSDNLSTEEMTFCHEGYEKISGEVVKDFHIKDPSIANTSNNIKNILIEDYSPVAEKILRKYISLNLPKYSYPPSNYKIMECCHNLKTDNVIKALELLSESSYAKENFSADFIFKTDTLIKALNGTYKDIDIFW